MLSTAKYVLKRFLSECQGGAASLSGTNGKFGMNKAQYKNDMVCGWKIEVEASKVNFWQT